MFGTQNLTGMFVVMIYGSEGMVLSADQYCERQEHLELSEYMEWIVEHKLSSCVCVNAGIKGFMNRRRIQKVADCMNDILKRGGSFLRDRQLFIGMYMEDPEQFEEVYPLCFGQEALSAGLEQFKRLSEGKEGLAWKAIAHR